MKKLLGIGIVLLLFGFLLSTQYATLNNDADGAWYSLDTGGETCLNASFENNTGCLVDNPANISIELTSENDWDYYRDDGDVKYAWAKWMIVREDSLVEQSDWYEINKSSEVNGSTTTNVTYTHGFDRTWTTTGNYTYTLVISEAESYYYSENDTWSDYEVTRTADYSYPFELIEAGQTPTTDNSLQDHFDSVVEDILNEITKIFEDNPTRIPSDR